MAVSQTWSSTYPVLLTCFASSFHVSLLSVSGNVSSNVFTLPCCLLRSECVTHSKVWGQVDSPMGTKIDGEVEQDSKQPGQLCKVESCLGLVSLEVFTHLVLHGPSKSTTAWENPLACEESTPKEKNI